MSLIFIFPNDMPVHVVDDYLKRIDDFAVLIYLAIPYR